MITFQTTEHSNYPVADITIAKYCDNKVQLLDPRGFTVEVSLDRFNVGSYGMNIQDRTITSECVWGFDGDKPTLMPVNGAAYDKARLNNIRRNKKLELKNISPGQVILFKNGEERIYLGTGVLHYQTLKEYNSRLHQRPPVESTDCHTKSIHAFVLAERHDWERNVTIVLLSRTSQLSSVVREASIDLAYFTNHPTARFVNTNGGRFMDDVWGLVDDEGRTYRSNPTNFKFVLDSISNS